MLLALLLAAGAPGALAEPPSDSSFDVPGAARVAKHESGLPSELLARRLVAETAIAQLSRIDPAWEEAQRDCAGLVRFAFRSAFRRLDPVRASSGPFRDASGQPAQFADAATLLKTSFVLTGRDDDARAAIRSGDLVAFAREDEAGAVYHLMIVVRPDNPARGKVLVVYHPGERGAAVRAGRLEDLARDAPPGWRPAPENPLFLGFYRLKEWSP